VTGHAAADSPKRSVQRLEIVESASVKKDGDALVVSTDSPPLPGVLNPGVYTLLKVLAPMTFVAGQVTRDAATGAPVAGALVTSLAPAGAAFVAPSDKTGKFVVGEPALGGPHAVGTLLSSRLDAFDTRYSRVIRRGVRGEVGAPAPVQTSVVHLAEAFVLPSKLAAELVAILGDVQPPTVEISLEPASGFVRAGAPVTVRLTAADDDRVAFLSVEVDAGSGFEQLTVSPDGVAQFTPATDGVVIIRANARDASGNEASASSRIRSLAAEPGAPLVPTPIAGRPPELLGAFAEQAPLRALRAGLESPSGPAASNGLRQVAVNGQHVELFTQPLSLMSVNANTVLVLDPEGAQVDVDIWVGADQSSIWVEPKRHYRMGATYTLQLTSEVRGLNGLPFEGSDTRFFVPQPELVATIDLPGTLDVDLVGDYLVASSMPMNTGAITRGQFHVFEVLDKASPGQLLAEPRKLSTTEAWGMPTSLASVGQSLFVGNRYLGRPMSKQVSGWLLNMVADSMTGSGLAEMAAAGFGMQMLGLANFIDELPSPPSNLQVWSLADPTAPKFSGSNWTNYAGRAVWNASAATHRLEVTTQGLALVNFQENIEMFTLEDTPTSIGVVESIGTPGEVVGRCGGSPAGAPCIGRSFWDVIDGIPEIKPCPGEQKCISVDDFADAAFLDGIAASLERGGLRLVSTAPADVRDGERDRTVAFYPLEGLGARFGRVAAVSRFGWTDRQGAAKESDLVLVATPYDRILRIFDVTTPSVPELLSETRNTWGTISIDRGAGLAYLHGIEGEFHVIDFKDPGNPIELNAPDPDLLPFSVVTLGLPTSWNANSNRAGAVFVANENGVAIVNTRLAPTLDDRCKTDNPCKRSSWFPGLGCVEALVPDGASCDDGLYCNGRDVCQVGVCVHGPSPALDDGKTCTLDVCLEGVGVIHPASPKGTSCDPSNLCRTCDGAGACGGPTASQLNDGNKCTTGSCDPATGKITPAPAPPCQLPAGFSAQCASVSCDPVKGCTTDTASYEGTSCDDGNPCNGIETCRAGVCEPGRPPEDWEMKKCGPNGTCSVCSGGACRDSDALCGTNYGCTTRRCVADSCVDPKWQLPGVSCGPADLLLSGAACSSCDGLGSCAPDNNKCDDKNQCTVDSCDPLKGCDHKVNTAYVPPENNANECWRCGEVAGVIGPVNLTADWRKECADTIENMKASSAGLNSWMLTIDQWDPATGSALPPKTVCNDGKDLDCEPLSKYMNEVAKYRLEVRAERGSVELQCASKAVEGQWVCDVTRSSLLPLEIAAPVNEKLPDATVGQKYAPIQIQSKGGAPRWEWNVVGLPPGLAASAINTVGAIEISGEPADGTAGQTYRVTVTVSCPDNFPPQGPISKTYTIFVR
jgi:hypothetical protein